MANPLDDIRPFSQYTDEDRYKAATAEGWTLEGGGDGYDGEDGRQRWTDGSEGGSLAYRTDGEVQYPGDGGRTYYKGQLNQLGYDSNDYIQWADANGLTQDQAMQQIYGQGSKYIEDPQHGRLVDAGEKDPSKWQLPKMSGFNNNWLDNFMDSGGLVKLLMGAVAAPLMADVAGGAVSQATRAGMTTGNAALDMGIAKAGTSAVVAGATGGNPLTAALTSGAMSGAGNVLSGADTAVNAGGLDGALGDSAANNPMAGGINDAAWGTNLQVPVTAMPQAVLNSSDAIEAGVKAMDATGAQNFNEAAQKLGYGSYTEMAGSINPDWVSGPAALAATAADKPAISQESLAKRIEDGETSAVPATAPATAPDPAVNTGGLDGDVGDTLWNNPMATTAPEPQSGGFISDAMKWAKDNEKLSTALVLAGVPTIGGFIKDAMGESTEEKMKATFTAKVEAEKQIADGIRANNNLSFLSLGRLKPTGKVLRKAGELPPGIINRARAQ